MEQHASKLDAALAWAARGFRVFPLIENTKDPLFQGWTTSATRDALTIKSWWTDSVTGWPRDYNVGVLTTGMVVLDVDVKRGKRGLDTYFNHLGLGLDTLTVRTPTGGYHAYYTGQNAAGEVDAFGKGCGLDIRSHNNYVLAPGSTIDGVSYSIEIDDAVKPLPPHVSGVLKQPRPDRPVGTSGVDEDTPEAISRAEHWLQYNAPLAIEGQGGDDTTFKVCARVVRDFALSPAMALALLLEHWNHRCEPPWPADELKHKIVNAAEYGTRSHGADTPQALFGEVDVPAPLYEASTQGKVFTFGNVLALNTIQPRPWVIHRMLMLRQVTALIAAGATGKSTLLLVIAAHLALGRDFLGFKVERPGRSVIYNAEDDREEQARRLYATCTLYGFDPALVVPKVCLLSSEDIPLTLVGGTDKPMLNKAHIDPLMEALMPPDVVLAAFDPLVELHSRNENDPGDMRYLMGVLRLIAQKSNTAVVVAHHTKKPTAAASTGYAGDAASARGSTAITNSSRIALTMYTADQKDCERYGIAEADRNKYVRLDDAKANLVLAGGEPVWMEKHTVRLHNGDEVGALRGARMEEDAAAVARMVARTLWIEMLTQNVSTLPIAQAVALLQNVEPLYANMTVSAARNRLERMLAKPVQADEGGASLGVVRAGSKIEVRIVEL